MSACCRWCPTSPLTHPMRLLLPLPACNCTPVPLPALRAHAAAGAAHAAAAESGPAGPSAASGHMHVHAAQPAAPAGAPLGAVSAAHVHVASSAGPKPSAAPKTSEGPVSAAGPAGPAGPAGAELTGDMARSLLGTTGCANNDLPAPPTNAQWVASRTCDPADQESNSNTECQAACLPGFTASGSFSATCSFYDSLYVWAATATSLACKRPGEVAATHPA